MRSAETRVNEIMTAALADVGAPLVGVRRRASMEGLAMTESQIEETARSPEYLSSVARFAIDDAAAVLAAESRKTQEKRAALDSALEACASLHDGRVFVAIAIDAEGVALPPSDKARDGVLMIAVSRRMAGPILVDAYGLTACLTFEGVPQIVRAPWSAVAGVSSASIYSGIDAYSDNELFAMILERERQQQQPPAAGNDTPQSVEPAAPSNVLPFRRPR